jgi:hypothetical protein
VLWGGFAFMTGLSSYSEATGNKNDVTSERVQGTGTTGTGGNRKHAYKLDGTFAQRYPRCSMMQRRPVMMRQKGGLGVRSGRCRVQP